MTDIWQSYGLTDLLMFSPQVYYRQIELANEDAWPAQFAMVATGVLVAWCVMFATRQRSRLVAAALAITWLSSGWFFISQRFSEIHLAGPYIEVLFYAQATALAGCALTAGGLNAGKNPNAKAGAAAFLAATITLAYPFLAPLTGRVLASAEMYGIAADPTALVTLFAISGTAGGWRWLLAVPPAIWLVLSATTLWAMGSPEAWFVLGGPVLAAAIAAWRAVRSRRRRSPLV